jgi:hypothetical protein
MVSLGYLSMILFSILFLNARYGGSNTLVMGAHRYSFVSPFMIVFLYYIAKYTIANKIKVIVFIFSNLFLVLFGAYSHIASFLTIALIPNLIIIGFMLYTNNKQQHSWLLLGIIVINFFFQLHLFQQFITPLYVD